MTAPARSRRRGSDSVPPRGRGRSRRPTGASGSGPVPQERAERFARPPLRIALRMAARTARRSLGRSILVAVMIAVPVAGMAGTAVVTASMEPTPSELVALQLGAEAEAVLEVVAPAGSGVRQNATAPIQGGWDTGENTDGITQGGTRVDPATLVDGDIVVESQGTAVVETTTGLRQVSAKEGELLRPELAGRYDLVVGEVPDRAGEVAVTPALLDALGARVGDTATIVASEGESEVNIVGVYRGSDTSRTSDEIVAYPGTFSDGTVVPYRYYLLDQELSWNDVLALNEQGVIAASRSVILDGGPTPGARPDGIGAFGFSGGYLAIAALIGGFLLLQVVLLAAAAFMVGARQQQRALAVLASVGGDRRLMRATVTAGGVVLGLVGGLLGIALGVAAAAAAIPLLSDGRATMFPGFHPAPLLLLGVLVVAVLAGWAAAAVPARIASRVDIVPALRGARRPAPPRRATRVLAVSVILAGALLLVAGGIVLVVVRGLEEYPPAADIVAVALIGLGAIVLQLGIVLGLPSILRQLARATGGARTSLRLAARDAGRNSARTVPVTAAVMTTVFLAAFIMSMLSANQQETDEAYLPSAPTDTVLIPTLVWDPLTQTQAIYDDVEGIRAAMLDIAPGAATAIVGGTQMDPDIVYDQATGGSMIAESSAGSTLARVFPHDSACRSWAFSSQSTQNRENCQATDAELSAVINVGMLLNSDIAVGSVTELELLTGMALTTESRQTLAQGGAIALSPLYVDAGEIEIDNLPAESFLDRDGQYVDWSSVSPASVDRLSAVVQVPAGAIPTRILISSATAEGLGLDMRPQLVMAQLDGSPTLAQRDAFMGLSQELTGDPNQLYPYVESGPPDTATIATWALVGVSAVIALAASSIAIGLSRIDGRRDEAILGAMGATRSLRRAVNMWQATLLAGVGSVIGAVLGVLTAGALALPGGPFSFAPPWLPLAIVAIGVPVLIGIGAWIFAGRSTALPTDRTAIA